MNTGTLFLAEIEKYDIITTNDQELAASELLQKMVLAGLAETDFFDRASFHGGTALRIFHGLQRYSQDLDFSLIEKDGKFGWEKYLLLIQKRMRDFGCALEIYDKSSRDNAMVIAEIRDLSIGRLLNFEWAAREEHPKKIMVKLELDSAPPAGSETIEQELTFPYPCKIRIDNLPTLFAGKCHALLCRDYKDYVKGRDWYDLLWYVNKKIEPNYVYLSAKINKSGPWENQNIKTNRYWVANAFKQKIETLDITMVKKDIERFVSKSERAAVNNWTRDTFLTAVDPFHPD